MNSPILTLVAPDFSALDPFGGRFKPVALWPVGPHTLLSLWLDHAVRTGHKRVILHAADRPTEIREALAGGAFWSIDVTVTSAPAPAEARLLVGLPGESGARIPLSTVDLLDWWQTLNVRWLEQRRASDVLIDRCVGDRVWLAPRVRIHPSAKLVGPCWIGADVEIGPGCCVGPHAFVGDGCVLHHDVDVRNSIVLSRTFLGEHLDVHAKIVAGSLLIDRVTGRCVGLNDAFIASSLSQTTDRVSLRERFVAALLILPAWILMLAGGAVNREQATLPGGEVLLLATRSRGPLLARRAAWLWHVIVGRMHLVGVLPRFPRGDLPADSDRLLDAVRPGAFAVSDLHGVHSSTDRSEAVHAAYQVAVPGADVPVWRNLLRLCWLRPSRCTP